MKKLVKAGYLRRYIKEAGHREELRSAVDRIIARAATQLELRQIINSILGGPSDDQYQSKRKQKKILRVATVKARVNCIYIEGSLEETRPIDGPRSFPHVNSNRIIMPHYDALVLTLCISGFDVQKVLVDPSSATDLLQLPAFNQMRLSLRVLNSVGIILSGFNGVTIVTLGDVMLPVRACLVSQQVLFSIIKDLGPYNTIMGWA